MRKVSLERYYFVLYNGVLTLKISKMALTPFCDKTLHKKLLCSIHFLVCIIIKWVQKTIMHACTLV